MSRLALALLLLAPAASAETWAVGDRVEGFTLDDQHGSPRAVDAGVRVVLFSRDMDGGELLKTVLAERDAAFLDAIAGVYVADISAMPGIVARLFAIPSLRKRPYPMLLDRDGAATAALPDVEGRATLIRLDALRVVAIEHYETREALAEAIAKLPVGATEPGGS